MKIEKVLIDDYEKIVKLNNKNKLINLEKAAWENLWLKNPYFINNKDNWPLGWKLLDNENNLVGVILNIPFIFKFKDQKILGAICNNYVIDKEYRSFSLKLRYLFLNQKNVDLYITNTANEKSEKIMAAFKARKINQYNYQDRLIFILKKRKFIFKIFKNLNIIFKSNFLDILFKKREKLQLKDINIFERDYLNPNDDFENNLNLNLSLYSSKKISWLKWKYDIYLKKRKLIVIKVLKKDEIIGCIFMIKNFYDKEKLERLSIVEILGFENHVDYFEESLNYCIKIGKKLNYDVIDVVGFNKFKRDIMKKMGFIAKKSKNFSFLIKNNNKKLDKILFDNVHNLDLSISDGDGIFYY